MAALDSEEPSAATSSSCGPEVASDSTSSNTTTNTSSSRSSNSSNSSNNNSGSSPSATPASAAQAPKEAQAHAAAMREAMVSCVGLKEQYDRCFNHWYRQHFLQGEMAQNCLHFFEDYRACIVEELAQKGLQHLAGQGPPL